MKKLVSLMLYLVVCNAYSKGEVNIKNDFSQDIIEASQRKIDYNLKVLKKEKVVYSSSFILENSSVIPIFYGEDKENLENLKEKAKGYEQGGMSSLSQASKSEKHSNFQLRMAVHVDKATNTMWSNFFIQELSASKNENAVTGNSKVNNADVKGIAVDSSPETKKLEQELIVIHQNGAETNFSWQEYTFIFTGKIH